MPQKQFPYADLTTPTLPGEKWVDVKGFKGAYQVSSHGRIRSVDRTVRVKNRWKQLRPVLKPGYIRKQKMQVLNGKFTKTPYYNCGVSLWKGNREYIIRTGRLVYEHFIGRLAKNLKVTHTDGDGRNNHYKNLLALDDSSIRKFAFEQGRQRPIVSFLSEGQKKKLYKKLSEKGKRPVQRISASGKVLKNFGSVDEAAKNAPCSPSYMTQVLKGRKTHVNGKLYRYSPGIETRWTR